MREHPYDKLNDHDYKKGVLKSPINKLENIETYSWKKECLPEFIWIALIFNNYSRNVAFSKFSSILKDFENLSFKLESLQLSYIFSLNENQQIELYNLFLKYIEVNTLSPLTIIFNSHKYKIFMEYFFINGFIVEDKLSILENIVDSYSNTKANETVDVQYIIITFYSLVKRVINIAPTLKETITALSKYPFTSYDNDEITKYQSFIRSIFNGVQDNIYEHNKEFINIFWKELSEIGDCNLKYGKYENKYLMDEEFIEDIKIEFQKLIIDNTYSEIEDSKFNVIMGSSVYVLKIFEELVECNLRNKVMGRLSLRIIIEVYIRLKFIAKKEVEKPDLWEKYQEYGIGKYKLILLKARDIYKSEHSHLNTEFIDLLINEQADEMFQDVDFRNFENKKIRYIAIEVNEKELYDLYYDYESSYAHGLWGAVRESSMLKCVNPLHLGHNVPDAHLKKNLSDVLPDAVKVFKKLLCFIDENYSLSEEFMYKYEVNK